MIITVTIPIIVVSKERDKWPVSSIAGNGKLF